MQSPLNLVFRGMEPSPALEARIRDRVARLERFYDRITSCDIAFDAPHRHQHKGNLYVVRLQIRVPGRDVVINRSGSQDHAHEDPYVAVRDAFDAAERKLEEFGHRRDRHAN